MTEAGFGADLGAREVPRHQVPQGRPGARLRGARRHHPRAQDARRRQEGGPEEGEPQGARSRHGQPAAPRREHEEIRPRPVVSINRFSADTDAEIALVKEKCKALGVEALMADHWAMGGEGAADVARAVVKIIDERQGQAQAALSRRDAAVREDPHHRQGNLSRQGRRPPTSRCSDQLKTWEEMGFGKLPVCIAKTQYIVLDQPGRQGRADRLTSSPVREVRLSAGAEFVVAICGEIMTMPGLPQGAGRRLDRRRRRRQDRRAVLRR